MKCLSQILTDVTLLKIAFPAVNWSKDLHANQVQKAEVIQSSISDHDLVCALLRLKKLRPKPTFVTTRSYKHYNPDAFLHDISQVPWSVIEAFSDVDDKLNAFDHVV